MKKKNSSTWALMVLVVLGTLSTSAWAFQNGQNPGQQDKPAGQKTKEAELPPAVRPNSDTLALVRRKGELRVGLTLFAPWSMRKKDGDLVGFEIDLARKMAADLGVEVKFAPASAN